MARQSFTLDDLRSDYNLASLFGAPRPGQWNEDLNGNRTFSGTLIDETGVSGGAPRGATVDDLNTWLQGLGNEIGYSERVGDNTNRGYYYTRQPDGSFTLSRTQDYYRPSSWVSARDNVVLPTLAAAGTMVGLQGLGAGGYLGADVASSVASQGGFLGTGAGGAFGPPAGSGGELMGPPADLANNFMGPPVAPGAGPMPVVPNPQLMGPPADLAPDFMGPPAGLAGPGPTPGTNPGGVVGSPGGPGGQTQIPGSNPIGGRPGSGAPGGGRNNMGNVLGALFGMYTAEEQRKRYDELMGKLDELYRPDSAYAMQMQDELARRDSAAGRGSQYGPRSVELAAKLTDSRRQALGQMALPIAGMGMTQNLMADNLNNLFTGENGNIFDAAGDIYDWGKDAWDWFSSRIPGLTGD